MKIILSILSVFLFSNLAHAQSAPCLSKLQVSNIVAEKFLDEYFGRANTSVFDDTFGFYFHSGSYNENISGVKEAFLTDDYRFNGISHSFESTHIFSGGDNEAHIEFAEFTIEVNCLKNNEIKAISSVDGFEGF